MQKRRYGWGLYLAALISAVLGSFTGAGIAQAQSDYQEQEEMYELDREQEGTTVLFNVPEGQTLGKGEFRGDWNYTFLRDNFTRRLYNSDQSVIGVRANRRKTHLVSWQAKYGLTDRIQPEAEVLYKAYRQHTHFDGEEHDRNDDGDFERLFAGLSYRAVEESDRFPGVRLRGGVLIPKRAETEGIGQEAGMEFMAASTRGFGASRITGSAGFGMTFDNQDQPADPLFEQSVPLSKEHDLRAFSYGVGLTHELHPDWQANLELHGRVFDTIELNRREQENELTFTPGIVYSMHRGEWDSWLGFGIPIGVTDDTDHIGVAIRTGARF